MKGGNEQGIAEKDVGRAKVGNDDDDVGGKLHRLTDDGISYHGPVSSLNSWSCAERHFGGANSLYRRSARQFQEGKVLCTWSPSSHCDVIRWKRGRQKRKKKKRKHQKGKRKKERHQERKRRPQKRKRQRNQSKKKKKRRERGEGE